MIKDGDIIEIDVEVRIINASDVIDVEWEKRRVAWKVLFLEVMLGMFYKYCKFVVSVLEGCIMDL